MAKKDTAAKALRRWFKPDKALGWKGVKWFKKDQADELIGHLWEQGWYVVQMDDLKPGAEERYTSKLLGGGF